MYHSVNKTPRTFEFAKVIFTNTKEISKDAKLHFIELEIHIYPQIVIHFKDNWVWNNLIAHIQWYDLIKYVWLREFIST